MIKSKFIYFVLIAAIGLLHHATTLYCSAEAGKKYWVKKIDIQGNKAISDRSIKKIMLTKERGRFSMPYFYEDLFDDDLKSIVRLYHNNGYLDVAISSDIDGRDKNELTLKIQIEEGQITSIDSIFFSGNHIFQESELKKLVSLNSGKPFNESLLEKDDYALLAHYAKEGYIDAIIKPSLDREQESQLISIYFHITEGVQVKISTIQIEGLKRIKPVVVTRELLLTPNSVCDFNKMLESQYRLYQTGLFETVSIKPVLEDSTHTDWRMLQVYVKEKNRGEMNFGIGFGSYEKLRGSVELFQNSFWGMSHQIGTRLRISYKNQRFEFSYTNPWLFGTRTKYDLTTFVEHQVEPNYELQGGGGKTTVGRELSRNDKIQLSYKYQDLIFSDIKDTTEIGERIRGNIRSIQLGYIRDTRDSQFNSTRGGYTEIKCESAGGFLKGTNTFIKITGESRYFLGLIQKPSVILGIRIYSGWIQNFGKSNSIPLNERFYAGGEGTIRGYDKRQVGPTTAQFIPIGGKMIFIYNLEVRYPIYRKFGGSLFWDIGNVWSRIQNTDYLRLRHGWGCGLRYNSPLGIIRVDVGLKINPRSYESSGEFYFTLGQIF